MPTRAQGNLSFSILEDTSAVAGFNAAAFIADVYNKLVKTSLDFLIAATQAAIHNRIAR
ncbi:MAG: hypothetical protein WBN90_02695 [Gammaproteobacteria bacterium]